MKRIRNIRSRWVIFVGLVILALSFAVGWRPGQAQSDPVGASFSENIATFEDGSFCSLSSVTPFNWDTVYFLQPGVSQEQAENILGFSAGRTVRGGDDGVMVFVLDGEVAAVLPLSSTENCYQVFASVFYDACTSPASYLSFSVLDPVSFEKNSAERGGAPWQTLSLTGNISAYVQISGGPRS